MIFLRLLGKMDAGRGLKGKLRRQQLKGYFWIFQDLSVRHNRNRSQTIFSFCYSVPSIFCQKSLSTLQPPYLQQMWCRDSNSSWQG